MRYVVLFLSLAMLMTLSCGNIGRGDPCIAGVACSLGLECREMPDNGTNECNDSRRCVRTCETAADCPDDCENCACMDPCGEGGVCVKVAEAS